MSRMTRDFFPEFIGEPIQPNFDALPEKIHTGMYILQKGRFVHVDKDLCAIVGVQHPDQILGRSLWQLVHPKDRAVVRLRQNRSDPAAAPVPFRIFQPNGETVWVAMQGVNTTVNAKPANIGCLIDMHAIRSLTRSLKRYQARISQVEDAIAELDLKGNLVFYSESAARLWGISCKDIIGKNYREFMDLPSASIANQSYQQVYVTGHTGNHINYEIIRADGRRMVVEDSVVLIRDREGRAAGFRTVSRDITAQKAIERKAAEQRTRLEAIFRSVTDAIITVDPQLNIINANAAAKTICGINPSEAVAQPLAKFQRHCSAACGDVLSQVLKERKTLKDFRIECRCEHQRRQIVDVTSSALLDPQEKFMGAVMVIRDVTRLRDLESQLQPRHHFQHLIGKSREMQEIYLLLEDLADLQTTVLVTGESGTGKNMLARALHGGGLRATRPFVSVNCSALVENLLESELFGHVKGAFTGAVQNKQGRFEAAGDGTIVLDEIGDISPLIQLKLLRVLQEKEYERVGESVGRKMNARVIACTHQNLQQKVERGEFREDLYYRLKVVEIHVPPLRDRVEDVPLLIEHFRALFNPRFQKKIQGVAPEAMAWIMNYAWPGNVRELEHVMERAFVLCDAPWITPSHLPSEVKSAQKTGGRVLTCQGSTADQQRQELLSALHQTHWNRTKTAQLLGISRQTLYRKLQECSLHEKPKR